MLLKWKLRMSELKTKIPRKGAIVCGEESVFVVCASPGEKL